jgi:hypothetical protein
MVGRGTSLDGRLFPGGTDGSNPASSSGESANFGSDVVFTRAGTDAGPLSAGQCARQRLAHQARRAGSPRDGAAVTGEPVNLFRVAYFAMLQRCRRQRSAAQGG